MQNITYELKKAFYAYTFGIGFLIISVNYFLNLYCNLVPGSYAMLMYMLLGVGCLLFTVSILKEVKSCLVESKPEDSQ